MYIQQTSTQSIAVVFGALFLLCVACGLAYCINVKKRRSQITMTPEPFPKAWFAVRQELIVPPNRLSRNQAHQVTQEFV